MPRTIATMSAVTLLASAFVFGQQPAPLAETSIYLTVVDKNDAPVANLQPADFTVTQSGRTVQSARVERDTGPIHAAVIFNGRQPPGLKEFAAAMLAANPATEIAITRYPTWAARSAPPGSMTFRFTSDLRELQRQLDAQASTDAQAVTNSGAATLARVLDACHDLEALGAGRNVVIVYHDGLADVNNLLDWPRESFIRSDDTVFAALEHAHASLWALLKSVPDPNGGEPPLGRFPDQAYTQASARSGGLSLLDGVAPADTPRNFLKLAGLLTNGYTLILRHDQTRDRIPLVEVNVNHPGVKVLSTRWPID